MVEPRIDSLRTTEGNAARGGSGSLSFGLGPCEVEWAPWTGRDWFDEAL